LWRRSIAGAVGRRRGGGIAEFGQIDILIANAGIGAGPVLEITERRGTRLIGTNLTGVWKSAKAVAPHMIERQDRVHRITSSVNGLERG